MTYYVDYVWSDGKIVTQYITVSSSVNTPSFIYIPANTAIPSKIIYDDNGMPQGFIFGDGVQFAFVRNLQGDVIAVVDQNGNIIIEYSYGPWGDIQYHLNKKYFSTEKDAQIFIELCPLTYRGYNYDVTTGLYYLQSRYYNPEWGRFINCDDKKKHIPCCHFPILPLLLRR